MKLYFQCAFSLLTIFNGCQSDLHKYTTGEISRKLEFFAFDDDTLSSDDIGLIDSLITLPECDSYGLRNSAIAYRKRKLFEKSINSAKRTLLDKSYNGQAATNILYENYRDLKSVDSALVYADKMLAFENDTVVFYSSRFKWCLKTNSGNNALNIATLHWAISMNQQKSVRRPYLNTR